MIADAVGSLAAPGIFEQATGRLTPALRGFGYRLTRDRTQADDLVQETLLRAWAARHRFIPNSSLKAWLFRIEYNCFVSLLRKTRRVLPLSPELENTRLIAPAAQEEALLMRDFDSALASLPLDQATAFVLINDEELAYEDAADRLGVPLGTVKSRTARARSALKLLLSDDGAEPRAAPKPRRAIAKRKPAPALTAPSSHPRYAAWKASGRRTIG